MKKNKHSLKISRSYFGETTLDGYPIATYVSWIETITPEQYNSYYTGDIVIRINPAKKDGTRSNRLFVLFGMEIDNIKKID